MIQTGFFVRTALNNLRRGGQRVWVALLCIAFGVMSLISMTLMAESIQRGIILDPSEQIGGDASLYRQDKAAILPEHVDALKALQQEGLVDRFTIEAATSDLIFHLPGSGNYHFVSTGIGIEPEVYPLAGNFVIEEPGDSGAAGLLQAVGDVLVTSDLAKKYQLAVGDALVLSTLDIGRPVDARVRGIVSDTPNHAGSKMYYSHATAGELANGQPAANMALVTSAKVEVVKTRLEAAGWWVYPAETQTDGEQSSEGLFDMLLRGAGVLGLLVGGIGIANTMQVLLRRRQREIAIWKAIGYSQANLQTMFIIEAAVLGLIGSLLGAGLGIAISHPLVEIFQRTGSMLIYWDINPSIGTLISSVLVGLLTTVISAMWAIVNASRVSPAGLLRDEPVSARQIPWVQSVMLALVLAVPFTALTSFVMGSMLKGVGVLLFALVGLVVLGGVLGGLAWAVTRLLPLRGFPLLRMAQQNLRRRGRSLVFAMIALFAGVITLALGVVVTQSAQRVYSGAKIDVQSYNLAVIARPEDQPVVESALGSLGVDKAVWGSQTSIQSARIVGAESDQKLTPTIIGRTEPYDYPINGAEWGSEPGGVYSFALDRIPLGTEIELTLLDGTTRALRTVGSYDIDFDGAVLPSELGLLVSWDMAQSLGQADSILVYGEAPTAQVAEISADLGTQLPDATVIDLLAYTARFTETYHNLFILAVAMASLALLAGILLVANSVSLAMLDRRYEIGILKAVGYTRGHVQQVLVTEYGLIAVIACLTGLIAVQIFFMVLAMANEVAGSLLVMTPSAAALIGFGGVGLVLATVLAITWKDTRVSPIVVLNDHG